MNFTIPRKNPSEMLLYIWKIIDLPNISMNELLYTISFELFFLTPNKAQEFIQSSIKNKLLEIDEKHTLSLSEPLKKTLKKWQANRKEAILSKIQTKEKNNKALDNFKKNKTSTFNTLLNAFLDKGTINRTASISEEDFNLIELDLQEGKIKAQVAGSKKLPYIIEINNIKKQIIHNCHDFQTKRAENKKFCKHLAKLFLLLKEKNEESATSFLREIADNINSWEFSS
ncbi:MAG: hypothetical protein EU532_02410 [Promethearchaeota archaeon]|nr:MAG: hypothetical protein EU532_02410 [Candidatus Lokiarchaeota archaeon]